jgi:hypothetical protein
VSTAPPINPAEFFTTIIRWLVKAMLAGWFGRRQSPQIGLALAGIREMQQLFQQLADLLAAGPEALMRLQQEAEARREARSQAASAPARRPRSGGTERGRPREDVPETPPPPPTATPQATAPPGPAPARSRAGAPRARPPRTWPAPPMSPAPPPARCGPPRKAQDKPVPWHVYFVTL